MGTESTGDVTLRNVGLEFEYNQVLAKKPGDSFDDADSSVWGVAGNPDSDYKAVKGTVSRASVSFTIGNLSSMKGNIFSDNKPGAFGIFDAKWGTAISLSKLTLDDGGTATWLGPALRADLFLGFTPFGFLELPIYAGLRANVDGRVGAVVKNDIASALPYFINLEGEGGVGIGIRGFIPGGDKSRLVLEAGASLAQGSLNTTMVYGGTLSGVYFSLTWSMW